MGTTREEPPTRAKVRGMLPGDSWREYVSEGAERAYDGPLAGGRVSAKKMARRGHLAAAHDKEKGSYRIRVRGYARKYAGQDKVDKAYTTRVLRLGPVQYRSRNLRVRKLTPGEQRAEQIKAVLGGVGGMKIAAGGLAGVVATDAFKDAQAKSKRVAVKAKEKVTPKKEGSMSKADEYQITAESIVASVAFRPVAKTDSPDLVDIAKGPISFIRGLAGKGLSKVTGPITDPLKKKAKKYALYGAAGLGGTVAAGTAVGNTISPRR